MTRTNAQDLQARSSKRRKVSSQSEPTPKSSTVAKDQDVRSKPVKSVKSSSTRKSESGVNSARISTRSDNPVSSTNGMDMNGGRNGDTKTRKRKQVEDTNLLNHDGDGDAVTVEFPTLKGMDSSDPSIRRNAMTKILHYLSTSTSKPLFTSTQSLQLWKSFHVSLYMHDSKNAISVQNLIRQLASTVSIVAGRISKPTSSHDDDEGEQVLVTYIEAFWMTMSREWSGIDSHRLNKYLSLVRFVLREIFKVGLSSSKDDGGSTGNGTGRLERQVEVIEKWPLNGKNRMVGDGLRLHVLDVWVDEIKSALGGGDDDVEDDDKWQVELLNRPLIKISHSDSGAQKHVRGKAKEVSKDFEEWLDTR